MTYIVLCAMVRNYSNNKDNLWGQGLTNWASCAQSDQISFTYLRKSNNCSKSSDVFPA